MHVVENVIKSLWNTEEYIITEIIHAINVNVVQDALIGNYFMKYVIIYIHKDKSDIIPGLEEHSKAIGEFYT